MNPVLERMPAPACEAPPFVPCKVRRVRRELADTYSMELLPPDGAGPSLFAPGQFNMLYGFGHGEIPISISGDPARTDHLVHTIKAVGARSRALTRVKRGDTVGVRGPFGQGWPVELAQGGDLLIMAGGVGLAPLRPVMYHVTRHRRRFKRVVLLYGARSAADLLFRDELERWRGRLDLEVLVTVDRATDDWRGTVGVVTALVPRVSFPLSNAVAMVCGPEVMMRFSTRALSLAGVHESRQYISVERNMHCGQGWCGHCQWGPWFVCKDGPVFRLDRVSSWLWRREV